MNKNVYSLLLILFAVSSVFAQNYTLKSKSLQVEIDSQTGGIQSIVNQQDKYLMNWILKSDSTQYPWQTRKLAWGLGSSVYVNGDTIPWNTPISKQFKDNHCTFTYRTKFFELSIERTLSKDGLFTERFQFTNTTDKPLKITNLGIYTPFNDNYPNSKTCVESRCNTHIWAGENSSYIFAERMGGETPHLGLVLTQGALKSYEIQNRNLKPNGSNARGTIILNPSDIQLDSKKTYTLQWTIFAANDWKNFYTQALNLGSIKATAKSLVVEKNQNVEVSFESKDKLKNVQCFLNEVPITFQQKANRVEVSVLPKTTGEQIVKITYNDHQTTFLKAFRIENIDSLLKKRANFIVNKQQLNSKYDLRDGAYMVYDTELQKIYLNDDKRAASDVNEARERVGMGVFLAMYLQKNPDKTLQTSLERYAKFVQNRLQKTDYSVPSTVLASTHKRVYNYPWVSQFYLEMYQLSQDKKYLTDSYKTLRKYFIDSKCSHYGIGVPAQKLLSELKKAGMTAEHDSILADCRKTADKFIVTSLYFPKHEVNYEQSIVSPSVVFLLEMYQITGEEKYLKEGEKQLKALEAFAGQQPDYHLNEIGIRHWDGFWFGKKKLWGDIMPHYWSTITSEAYVRYAQITGKKEYFQRAETILKNNLCLFFNDGTASCAYVYPSKVNGQKAACYDPFANDQDWALVFYLKALELMSKK